MKRIFSLHSDVYFRESYRFVYEMESDKSMLSVGGNNNEMLGEEIFGPSEKVKEVLERMPRYEEVKTFIEKNGLMEKVQEDTFIENFVKSYIEIHDLTLRAYHPFNNISDGSKEVLEMEIFRALKNMKKADSLTGNIAAISMGIERCEQECRMKINLLFEE